MNFFSNGLAFSCWTFAFACGLRQVGVRCSSPGPNWFKRGFGFQNWTLFSDRCQNFETFRPEGWRKKINGLCGMGVARSSKWPEVVQVARGRPSDKTRTLKVTFGFEFQNWALFADCCQNFETFMPKGWRKKIYGLCGMGLAEVVQVVRQDL